MTDKNFKVTTKMPHLDPEVPESALNLFDPENADISMFNLIDDELIRLSGSKMYFYLFVGSDDFNDVYMESRNKVVTKEPITVFGHYDPDVIQEPMSNFGIEMRSDQIFTFNKSYIERKLGRAPKEGDVIKPAFQDIKYKVEEVQEDEFKGYGIFHYTCTAKVLRDSPDVQDTIITQETDPIGHEEFE